MTAVLAILVVAVVTTIVAYPLWRPGPQAPPDPIGPAATLAALQERKLQLYAAIRELGFDYRTDKLEEADYEEEVERIKAEAVAVVRQIDALENQPPRGPDELEAEIAAVRDQLSTDDATQDPRAMSASAAGDESHFCTQCGKGASPGDRFCAACGSPLRAS